MNSKIPSNTAFEEVENDGEFVRQRSGLLEYCQRNLRVTIMLICSISVILGLFAFTLLIGSRKIMDCAALSNCSTSPTIAWISNHMGVVQGLVTFLYLAGLAGILYAACALFEAGLWAVLARQSLNLAQLESYISVSQGSLLAAPSVLFASKSAPAFSLLFLIIVSALAPLSGAPAVGYVYEVRNASIRVDSSWSPGGGYGPIFAQRNPPTSISGGTVALYTAWSRGISIEPLPEYRDWYLNRKALVGRGNMTVDAIRIQKHVSCEGAPLQQINMSTPANNGFLQFPSNMKNQNSRGQSKNSTDNVQVRTYAALTVWANDFAFIHENRTSASLIFASLNGTIEGGVTSTINDTYIKSVSAVKCTIDIEFIDDTLIVGNGGLPAPVATLSSNNGVHVGHCNTSSPAHGCDQYASGAWMSKMPNSSNTLNEVILFFAMAPLLAGISVDGSQPQFQSQLDTSPLPLLYTSTDPTNNTWSQLEISTFIDVSIGATAISSSTNFQTDHQPLNLTSTIYTRKLSASRSPLLLIPPLIMLLCVILLALVNNYLHNKYNLPVMRGAPLREILRSMHTQYMQELIYPDARNWHRHGELADINVKYGVSESEHGEVQVGLGDPKKVKGFRRHGNGRMERRMTNVSVVETPVEEMKKPWDAAPMLGARNEPAARFHDFDFHFDRREPVDS